MKKLLYLALFGFSIAGTAQTVTENFVKTTTFKGPGGTLPVAQVTYFDGLGRPIQQLVQGQSATGKDIITHIEYDAFGRQKKDYLPYAGASNAMTFDPSGRTSTESFYADINKVQETTTIPFSDKLFEASPLNRVLKQAAPGYDWRLGGGKEIKLDYQTNTATEVKKFVVTTTWNVTSKLYDISIATSGN